MVMQCDGDGTFKIDDTANTVLGRLKVNESME